MRTRSEEWDSPEIGGQGKNGSEMRSKDVREETPVLRGSGLGPLQELREK